MRGVRPALTLTAALIVTALVFFVLDHQSEGTSLAPDLFSLAVPGTYIAVGGLLATRLPENSVGRLCLLVGLFWAALDAGDALSGWAGHTGLLGLASWAGLAALLWVPPVGLTNHLALRLPNGRLLSPGWRRYSWFCTVAIVLVSLLVVTEPGRVNDLPGTHNPIGSDQLQTLGPLFALMPISLLGAIGSLALRYRRAEGIERLQLRWIALGGLVILVIGGALSISTLLGSIGSSGLPAGVAVLDAIANMAIPLAIGIAVMRYRLYEIDVVINRALVYGLLTLTLAATYVGLVLVLQLALDPVTHKSNLAIAASTLAVAALFQPARTRIQAAVDRRFFRRKYDAARTLEAFAARLRDEVDLETLGGDLRAVVGDTMQPAHVSLWLRSP